MITLFMDSWTLQPTYWKLHVPSICVMYQSVKNIITIYDRYLRRTGFYLRWILFNGWGLEKPPGTNMNYLFLEREWYSRRNVIDLIPRWKSFNQLLLDVSIVIVFYSILIVFKGRYIDKIYKNLLQNHWANFRPTKIGAKHPCAREIQIC